MTPFRAVSWPLSVEPYWRRVPGSRALLHAIAENLDDDDIRLVLADLCDDYGECARAEFIRLQVAPARLSLSDAEADTRAAELLAENVAAWAEGLPAIAGVDWPRPDNFARGLLCGVDLATLPEDDSLAAIFAAVDLRVLTVGHLDRGPGASAHLFDRLTWLTIERCDSVGHLAGLLDAVPSGNLRSLTLEGMAEVEGVADVLAAAAGLRNLLALGVASAPIRRDGLEALLASPHLRKLDFLRLESCELDAEAAGVLAAWPGATALNGINLEANDIGDAGAAALAASPYLGGLVELYLSGNDIGPDGAAALAASPGLAAVETLGLEGSALGERGIVALGPRVVVNGVIDVRGVRDAGLFTLLRAWGDQDVEVLNLAGCGLSDAALFALAAHPALRSVRALDVSANDYSAAAFAALLASPYLAELEDLTARFPAPPADGWVAFRPWVWPRGLTALRLASCAVGDDGCAFLARSLMPERLTLLSLSGAGIGPSGIAALFPPDLPPGTAGLYLARNPIGDAGAATLAACAGLRSVETLSVGDSGMTAVGVSALLSSPNLSGLRVMIAFQITLDAAGVRRIAAGPCPPSMERLSFSATRDAESAVADLRETEAFRRVTIRVYFPPAEDTP